MIDFFFSHALPKVTTTCAMSDLPTVYVFDERLSEEEVLYRMVRILKAAIPDGRWRMVRKVSYLIKAQPEFLVMRDTQGSNLMYLISENFLDFTDVVDIFFEGSSSVRGMFYEKNNFGISAIAYIVDGLACCVIHRGKEIKETVDAIIEKVREDGKHDVADALLEIWRKNTSKQPAWLLSR